MKRKKAAAFAAVMLFLEKEKADYAEELQEKNAPRPNTSPWVLYGRNTTAHYTKMLQSRCFSRKGYRINAAASGTLLRGMIHRKTKHLTFSQCCKIGQAAERRNRFNNIKLSS